MALQHLRSSTANKRPTPGSMSDGQLALNTNVASPGAFFKDSTGALVKAGPVHVGTTAPNASPAGSSGNSIGEQWLDTSASPAQLKVWNGTAWVSALPDELPVSKLADGSARQLLQTDAAGTGVEWTSSVDVPGTLDVTGATTLDSTLTVPAGSAAAPTVRFTGDTNTGIYSPGADQVAISTNGTGRLFVDSSGNVGIGNSSQTSYNSSADNLVIGSSGSNGITIASSNTGAGYIMFADGTTGQQAYAGQITYDHASNYLSFSTSAIERLRIDSSGSLGLGNSSPSSYNASAGDLVVGNHTGAHGVTICSQNNSSGYIMFADGTTGTETYSGQITYDHTNNRLTFGTTNGTTGLTIDSSQRVGIGTTSPGYLLDVAGDMRLGTSAGSGNSIYFTRSGQSDAARVACDSSSNLQFWTATSERARIDSSGRLLVGTSSTSAASKAVFQGNSSSAAAGPEIYFQRGSTPTGTNGLGYLYFADNASSIAASIVSTADGGTWTPGSSHPGRLVFSTTADGASSPTERMRLNKDGELDNYSSGSYIYKARSSSAAGSSAYLYWGAHSATSTVNGTQCYYVTTNGDVRNTNNSYGAISDIKLKENIVDASSQWDDLKALQVRNYNFKEGQTHTQIGLIAQEVEQVSPGLVSESPDRDEDGNDLGTVTKSVNYSVLYMKAVKALQEAMERIETLEQRLNDAGIA